MTINLNTRKQCEQKYTIIAFDLAQSRQIPIRERALLQSKIIEHSLLIRQVFPNSFIDEEPLIPFDTDISYIRGYLLEPFIFGDMWVLTLRKDANVDDIVHYFKNQLLPDYPFYFQIGYYDSHDLTHSKTWCRQDELYFLNEYMNKTRMIS